ncbi:MAG: kelch repeat-containing protein [Planctomycetaceae bacterium]|nr:kelch repeat-containing protein [Planctomycetaceae bacterium]
MSRSILPLVAAMPWLVVWAGAMAAEPAEAQQQVNTWIKRTPLDQTPVSPRLGYEGACVWDSRHQLLVRYGGHNQGGGGEQGAEVWTWDPATAKWTLKEPNTSPPGVCCNAQNVYDPTSGRYIRFPFFSGSHGWQWSRELYLNDSSVWTYDLATNRWRNMRPLPAPRLAPYRCASWDSDEQVVVVFGGEGSHEGTLIYDPAHNAWRWPKPPDQPDERSGGSMAYDAARKVHVLFGSQFTDDPHTWTYDVRKNEWRDMQPEMQPPTDKNDAVLTYDPIHRVVLAIVKVTTGKDDEAKHELQTWTYDAGANRWQRMNPASEPQPSGNRARQLIFAPELNLAILENCTSKPREQQIWTYRFAESSAAAPEPPKRRAAPPLVEDTVVSVVSPTRVEIAWPAPSGMPVSGYLVERAAVEVWSDDQLRRLKQRTAPLAEPVVGAIRRIGPFARLTPKAIATTTYADDTVDLSKPQAIEGEPSFDRPLHAEHLDESGRAYRWGVFAYRIRAVDETGTEGGPSAAVLTIPSSPQHFFSRENGTTCQLKWSPNPEKGIAGYRVYRMDGRFDKEPVSRLTSEPLAATTFEDATAGKATRRYYVLAVDALGQEGFPSSPVWFQREWRDYYVPFIGEWHQ